MRILVVEDNKRLSELISGALEAAGYVVDSASNIHDAEQFLTLGAFRLIVLDLSLPDGNGRSLLRAARARNENLGILVVTATLDARSRVDTLEEGADDYLGKPFEMEELVARVRAICRRPRQMRRRVLEVTNLSLDVDEMCLQVDGRVVDLPRRELNGLLLLLQNFGGLVPRKKLEHALYSLDEAFTPNAMEAVISRLRKRLENADAKVTVIAMRGVGYILSEKS
jgi:DNA-binding response OmpR family regulator